MAKKSKIQQQREAHEREEARKIHRRRVRRLAILKLRWVKAAVGGYELTPTQVDLRHHDLEVEIRQAKADLWRSIPDCRRMTGTRRGNRQLDVNHDRWVALAKLNKDVKEAVGEIRRRKHPSPRLEPADMAQGQEAKRYGPYDVTLDELPEILAMDLDQMVPHLHARQHRMNQPARFTPDGRPAGSTTPPPPPNPSPPSGRPQPPQRLPMSCEAAEATEMPFGKHQGQTLGWMLGDDAGMSYLHWLCTKAEIKSQNLREALDVIWTHYQGELETARG